MHTGGHVASHSRTSDPVVRVPQKATGDVPAEKISGAAKASPFFKELKEVLPTSKKEEQKVIAQAVEEVKSEPVEEVKKSTEAKKTGSKKDKK